MAGLGVALVVLTALPGGAQERDPALDLYYVANGAYNRKLYPAAIEGFRNFLGRHGGHPKADLARRGLALSFYANLQFEEAVPLLGELLGRDRLDPEINRDRLVMMQGQCLLRTGRKEEAKAHFVKEAGGLQDESLKTAALAVICDLSFGSQEWEEVRVWVDRLMKTGVTPGQAVRGLYQQGFALYQLGDYEQAGATLAKIAPLEVEGLWKTRASYLIGECYSQGNDFERAAPAYAAALGGLQGADRVECRRRLGVAHFAMEEWEKAESQFTAYLAEARKLGLLEDPKEAGKEREARLYLGRCQLHLKRPAEAEKQLAGLVEGSDEVAARASLWLARIFSQAGTPDFDKAAGTLEQAVQRFPGSPLVNDLRLDLATALMSRPNPDWKRAAEELSRIETGAFAQEAEVLLQRATCLHKLADFQASNQLLGDFLARFPTHASVSEARFLKAENLFLLDQYEPAARAYEEFLGAGESHPSGAAARYRQAQIHHHGGRWEQALAVVQPLLNEQDPGRFPQLSFLVGDSHFRMEDWEAAIEPLGRFVAAHVRREADGKHSVEAEPNVDTALLELAVACARTGAPERAREHLAVLVADYPKATPHLAVALAEQGRLAFEAEDLKSARAAFERFREEDSANQEPFRTQAAPHRLRVAYYLGWVESAAGEHSAAAAHFGEVVRIDPNHELAPDAALQQGLALLAAEDFAGAARHFPQVLQRYPKHAEAGRLTYFAGLSLAREKNWPQAAGYLKRVVDAHPDSEFADQALYEWAWCERSQDRNGEAVKLYERFVERYPQSPLLVKVQSELAELNLGSGDQDMVIARLGETLKDLKDESLREDLRYQLASAHFRKGDFETAATQFEDLLADYPDSKVRASVLFQAGESRLKLKETVAARAHFAAGLAATGPEDPLRESMMFRLGEMQAATGAHSEARVTYGEFLVAFPESAWTRNARFGLAWSLENTDDPEGAIAEYTKLLEAKGSKADLWAVRARFQTGECYFNMQAYENAVLVFREVEEGYKEHPSWQAKSLLEIGRVRLAQGRREEAEAGFKDVLTRFPKEKAALVARQYLDQLRAQQ